MFHCAKFQKDWTTFILDLLQGSPLWIFVLNSRYHIWIILIFFTVLFYWKTYFHSAVLLKNIIFVAKNLKSNWKNCIDKTDSCLISDKGKNQNILCTKNSNKYHLTKTTLKSWQNKKDHILLGKLKIDKVSRHLIQIPFCQHSNKLFSLLVLRWFYQSKCIFCNLDIRYSLTFEFQLPHLNLSKTLVTDQKWHWSHFSNSYPDYARRRRK